MAIVPPISHHLWSSIAILQCVNEDVNVCIYMHTITMIMNIHNNDNYGTSMSYMQLHYIIVACISTLKFEKVRLKVASHGMTAVFVLSVSNTKQPIASCKKRVWPSKSLWWKKMWNPRWRPRNGCDGRLMVKILITTVQVDFVPIDQAAPKFTWIVVIIIFTINLLS